MQTDRQASRQTEKELTADNDTGDNKLVTCSHWERKYCNQQGQQHSPDTCPSAVRMATIEEAGKRWLISRPTVYW